jgi:hypothetical protein
MNKKKSSYHSFMKLALCYKEDDEKYFIFTDKHGRECFLGQVQIAVLWLQKC